MQADEGTIRILAGFFAGEGCIGIRKSSKKSKSPSLVVELGNTEKLWTDMFQEYFGGYTRIYYPKRYKNSLPYYHWTLKDEKAGIFLTTILPFLLGEKRPQAQIGLQLVEIKAKRPNRNIRGKLGHFPSEDIEIMQRLEENLRGLRRAAAETKRTNGTPSRSDSPILEVIPAQ